jgi:AraC-like DNA-binding protein
MCRPEWIHAMTAAQRLPDLARLRRVRDRIDRDYLQPLDIGALARAVDMSADELCREFQAAFGESPESHLMTRRVACAIALLGRGDISATDVRAAVGSPSPVAFSDRFTEIVGVPPGAYRRPHRRVCTPASSSRFPSPDPS